MEQVEHGYWIDNVVLPIHLSLGALPTKEEARNFDVIVGSGSVFKQCEDYIGEHFPHATLMTVPDIETALDDIRKNRTNTPCGY